MVLPPCLAIFGTQIEFQLVFKWRRGFLQIKFNDLYHFATFIVSCSFVSFGFLKTDVSKKKKKKKQEEENDDV